ncbi:MAG: hypothetical protein Q9191_007922 [Dirinaria sp. TL-2023a]
MVLWFLALPLLRTVAAAPGIVFPVNSQVPPVARVSKAFQFTFALSTFSSDAGSTNYTLSGAPRWLQLDSLSRSLFGTPDPQDAGAPTFNLVASDPTGSCAMAVTLVVSAEPGPSLGRPVADQLAVFGGFSSPQSLIMAYASPLSLSFSRDTFTNTNGNTVYYALCANNTPLPSWISFDPANLAFSGTTPQSTSPGELSQIYNIYLTASDVVGFAGAIASFQIVVETHIFEFGPEPKQVDTTPGVFVNYSGLQNSLTLDGIPVNISELSQVATNAPSWLSLDNETLILSGSPPDDVSSTNFTISATDKYGDQADTTVFIQTSNSTTCSLLPNTLGPVNATINSVFAYSLGGALDSTPDLLVAVDLSDTPWLKFDPTSRTIEGNVPNNIKPGEVRLGITATEGGRSQNATLTIDIIPRATTSSAPSTSGPSSTVGGGRPASPSSTSGTHDSAAGLSVNGAHTKKWIAAAVVVPLLAALGVCIMLLCWCRKRRRISKQGYMKPSKEQVSRPRPISAFNMTSFMPPRKPSSTPRPPSSIIQGEALRSRIPAFQHRSIDSILQEKASSNPPKVDLKRQSRSLFSAVGLPQEPYAALLAAESTPTYELAPEDQQRLSQSSKGTSKKTRLSRVPDISEISHGWRPHQTSVQTKRRSAVSIGSSATPFISCATAMAVRQATALFEIRGGARRNQHQAAGRPQQTVLRASILEANARRLWRRIYALFLDRQPRIP